MTNNNNNNTPPEKHPIWVYALNIVLVVIASLAGFARYIKIASIFTLLAIMLALVFAAPTGNLIKLNQAFHPELIKNLQTIPAAVEIIAVDALDTNTSNAILASGKQVGTHHSYGYKDPIGTLPGLKSVWNSGFLRPLLINMSKTQTLTLKEQIDSGVTYFDIRISKDENNQILVDHGIIFGTLEEFHKEFKEAFKGADENKQYQLDVRVSHHNTNDLRYADAFNILRDLDKLLFLNIYPREEVGYVQSNSSSVVIEETRNSNEKLMFAIVTPGIKQFLLYAVPVVIFFIIIVFSNRKVLTMFEKMGSKMYSKVHSMEDQIDNKIQEEEDHQEEEEEENYKNNNEKGNII